MHGDGPNIGMIKRDLESHPLEPRERVPSRNIGSGPQSPAPYKDQVRDSNIDCYRSTSSFSNSNSWRDPNERGDRERDDRTWRGDGERGRDYVGGGRDWKRSFAHPDNRDNRGSGDRRECKHLLSSSHIPSSTRRPPEIFVSRSPFCPLISHRFSAFYSLSPLNHRARVIGFHGGGSMAASAPFTHRLRFPTHPTTLPKKKGERALIHSRHLRHSVLLSRPRQTLKSELSMS